MSADRPTARPAAEPAVRRRLAGLVLVATALFFAWSLVMVHRVLGAGLPWLGLLLMFYFLALAKIAEPLFTLRVPACSFPLRRWERSRALPRWLAVGAFGALLRGTPLRYLNTAVYLAGKQRDPQLVCRLVAAAEASHFWAALLLTPFLVYTWTAGRFWLGSFLLLVQALFNVYPILHLRQVRQRLERVLAVRRAKIERPPTTA